ncbi:hypothetical protein MIZ03_0699 [Rhodoferax lithotrophicus]|uniref:Uncharacterized protein n=1 Tax=Rhodoferax lithotrophicus TaxID=2798804 RepID=A0ABM7MHV9_9BURK|nr:hypothetical protein [Rhodoferax sp. MIZ03]BCO25820.1 hypothetical protein MIZ03_0699 [Rhodoferax sp. MIZ03]
MQPETPNGSVLMCVGRGRGQATYANALHLQLRLGGTWVTQRYGIYRKTRGTGGRFGTTTSPLGPASTSWKSPGYDFAQDIDTNIDEARVCGFYTDLHR